MIMMPHIALLPLWVGTTHAAIAACGRGGGTPLGGTTPPVGRDGTIVVLSWCYRGAELMPK